MNARNCTERVPGIGQKLVRHGSKIGQKLVFKEDQKLKRLWLELGQKLVRNWTEIEPEIGLKECHKLVRTWPEIGQKLD